MGINELFAQPTIWTGPTAIITKANFADINVEGNQDRITNNVWITRGNSGGGVFNIFTESNYTKYISPADTEWAFGVTANIGTLTFDDFQHTHNDNAPSIVNQNMVLHLISDDIYIDIKFTSWTEGPENGGGFSYERSSNQNLSISDFEATKTHVVYPNPSNDFIQITNIKGDQQYKVFNLLGKKIREGILYNKQPLTIQNLKKGLYFIQLEKGGILKFIKN
jgi:hypothetical protein